MIMDLLLRGRNTLTDERKDKLAQVGRFLSAIKLMPDAAFTRQWQHANINYSIAKNLIDGLLANGYVDSFSKRSRTQYRISVKGRAFLSKILECYMCLEEVEFCVDNVIAIKEGKVLEEITK